MQPGLAAGGAGGGGAIPGGELSGTRKTLLGVSAAVIPPQPCSVRAVWHCPSMAPPQVSAWQLLVGAASGHIDIQLRAWLKTDLVASFSLFALQLRCVSLAHGVASNPHQLR